MARSPRPAAYHLLNIAGKQEAERLRYREPAVVCPSGCGTQVMPADLQSHLSGRCPGDREPGPASIWVSRRQAEGLGVPARTIQYWARTGRVRSRGPSMDREYLFRDLAVRAARRQLDRRR